MTPDTSLLRQKALAAAASVVLALGAAGCPTPYPSAETGDTSLTDSATADSGTGDLGPDCTTGDTATLMDCCSERAEWCAAEHGADTQEAQDCTYGPDFDGSTGCIPWGPPAPPRFRGALA